MPLYAAQISEAIVADPNNTFGVVINMVPPGSDVLEIGCATGYISRYLSAERYCRVIGVEINGDAARLARPHCLQVIVGDVEDPATLQQAGGPFDAVLLADVLEHLREPLATLIRLRPLVRPNGRVVVSLPNVAHWSIRRSLCHGLWEYGDRGILDRTHLRFFTLRSASVMLTTAGLRVKEHRNSYIFPAHWRMGLGAWLAARAQKHHLPRWFDELFAYQFIFQAELP